MDSWGVTWRLSYMHVHGKPNDLIGYQLILQLFRDWVSHSVVGWDPLEEKWGEKKKKTRNILTNIHCPRLCGFSQRRSLLRSFRNRHALVSLHFGVSFWYFPNLFSLIPFRWTFAVLPDRQRAPWIAGSSARPFSSSRSIKQNSTFVAVCTSSPIYALERSHSGPFGLSVEARRWILLYPTKRRSTIWKKKKKYKLTQIFPEKEDEKEKEDTEKKKKGKGREAHKRNKDSVHHKIIDVVWRHFFLQVSILPSD